MMSPKVGDRVCWKHDQKVFKTGLLPAGTMGTVIEVGFLAILVRTDAGVVVEFTSLDFGMFGNLALLPPKKCCCKCHD